MLPTNPTLIPVVAAALVSEDGRILMHRRREGSAHGGLWEFPGGKIERGETPEQALARELEEELGIITDMQAFSAVGFARNTGADAAIEISLYASRQWIGELQCLEGEEICWFDVDQIPALAMPPLDYQLADQLVDFLSRQAK